MTPTIVLCGSGSISGFGKPRMEPGIGHAGNVRPRSARTGSDWFDQQRPTDPGMELYRGSPRLEKNKVLEHGQAVGISPKEWIRTWIVNSRLEPGSWAIWLDLEAEE